MNLAIAILGKLRDSVQQKRANGYSRDFVLLGKLRIPQNRILIEHLMEIIKRPEGCSLLQLYNLKPVSK